jgi:uncharacterized Fe-S cluster protein YjdI
MTPSTKLHQYEGRGGIVTYDAKRCIHAAECVHGLPAVFDSKAKPWINPDGADAAALAAVVDRCQAGRCTSRKRMELPNRAGAEHRDAHGGRPTYLRGELALMARTAASRSTTHEWRCAGAGHRKTSPCATAATARAASGTTARCRQAKRRPRRSPAAGWRSGRAATAR